MKEEIIRLLKRIKLLSKDYSSFELDEPDDWNFCLDYFDKWCKALDYKLNYESFYYFLLQYDDEGISIEDGVLKFNSGDYRGIVNVQTNLWYTDGLSLRINSSPFYNLL